LTRRGARLATVVTILTVIGLVAVAYLAPEGGPASSGEASTTVDVLRTAWAPRAERSEGPVGTERGDHDEEVDAPFAPSLAGTTPDGALVVDASGAFVPTPDALDFFDYYLSTLGERSLDEIVETLEREIRARVDPPDAALALLDQYLRYRDAVRELATTRGVDRIPLEQRLQWLRETRRDAFGAELAGRLFGEEEARLRDAIERRRIAADPTLDPAEREERIADLDAALPEAERARRARVTVARRVLDQEASMRDVGRTEAEIDAWRRREFGDAAAARLAELDRRRAEWDARVTDYREQRDALLAESPLEPDAAAAEVEALRASLFQGPELRRIRALDAAASR
jgi:lipase chaperone LimK